MLSSSNNIIQSGGTRSVNVLSTNEIIECFGKIMIGYFLLMEQSEIVKRSNHIDIILYNGANIVIHVFTMHVYSNESLENICNQCCKSYVCYLEYIEQLDKTNLANNLYISDISIFVYKQTLEELDHGSQSDSPNKHILELLTGVWNTILVWNNPISLSARVAICDIHFNKFVKLLHNIHEKTKMSIISGDDTSSQDKDINIYAYLDYLKIIQEKWEMDEHVYFIFLNEYYRVLYNLYKYSKLPTKTDMMEQMTLFCTQYLEYTPTVDNMRSIVKQLF
jgi:ribosomal protein L30E